MNGLIPFWNGDTWNTNKMSGAYEQMRKRHPLKTFMISTEMKVQDQLEGTIRLHRGYICQEQDTGKTRGDCLWVKVLEYIYIYRVTSSKWSHGLTIELTEICKYLAYVVGDPKTLKQCKSRVDCKSIEFKTSWEQIVYYTVRNSIIYFRADMISCFFLFLIAIVSVNF